MSDGYKIRGQTLPHFVTATVVDWVDLPAGRCFYKKKLLRHRYRHRKLERHIVMGAKSETFAQHPRNNDVCYKEHFVELGELGVYIVSTEKKNRIE